MDFKTFLSKYKPPLTQTDIDEIAAYHEKTLQEGKMFREAKAKEVTEKNAVA